MKIKNHGYIIATHNNKCFLNFTVPLHQPLKYAIIHDSLVNWQCYNFRMERYLQSHNKMNHPEYNIMDFFSNKNNILSNKKVNETQLLPRKLVKILEIKTKLIKKMIFDILLQLDVNKKQ